MSSVDFELEAATYVYVLPSVTSGLEIIMVVCMKMIISLQTFLSLSLTHSLTRAHTHTLFSLSLSPLPLPLSLAHSLLLTTFTMQKPMVSLPLLWDSSYATVVRSPSKMTTDSVSLRILSGTWNASCVPSVSNAWTRAVRVSLRMGDRTARRTMSGKPGSR